MDGAVFIIVTTGSRTDDSDLRGHAYHFNTGRQQQIRCRFVKK